MARKNSNKEMYIGYTQVDPKTTDETQLGLAKMEFYNSQIGKFLGAICIIGGVVLFLNGISGSSSWTAKFLGAESKLTEAAPGIILFVIGLFVVFISRYKFVHKKK